MMWSYDGFIAKAQVYFKRAAEHPHADDDEFGIWLLLGLEFLLRAPLARENPLLLADPTGDSIMHAAGFPSKKNKVDPKSIATRTVIDRLARIVEGFTPEIQDAATFVVGLRNHEIHSSESPLGMDKSVWLPKFTRAVEVIAAHLNLDLLDLLSKGIVDLGRSLVAEDDKRLEHEVRQRIEAAREVFSSLDVAELERRRQSVIFSPMAEPCPGCGVEGSAKERHVRATNRLLVGGQVYEDDEFVIVGLDCPVCGLKLNSTAEVRAAGLKQFHALAGGITVEQVYFDTFEPDYDSD